MTIQDASERYHIPMHILLEYESWGLCGAVKTVMGDCQYDDADLARLSTIMTLHDIGFAAAEVEAYILSKRQTILIGIGGNYGTIPLYQVGKRTK